MAHVLHEYMRKKGTAGPQCQGMVLGSSWLSTVHQDWAFLAKQQRCEYLKQKLTHIKARIQEYDRDCAGTF
ncbi:hypothetical protein AAES_127117 [Amazona aestiva]|uniref:OCEL domain-containing protein n=1 Tax=Amazona aestiva TaxID=12930 RepID=A0A0Q3M3Z9_AMAAE|nr:hypothetical protein AAES_127117 [Amazona aestiva]